MTDRRAGEGPGGARRRVRQRTRTRLSLGRLRAAHTSGAPATSRVRPARQARLPEPWTAARATSRAAAALGDALCAVGPAPRFADVQAGPQLEMCRPGAWRRARLYCDARPAHRGRPAAPKARHREKAHSARLTVLVSRYRTHWQPARLSSCSPLHRFGRRGEAQLDVHQRPRAKSLCVRGRTRALGRTAPTAALDPDGQSGAHHRDARRRPQRRRPRSAEARAPVALENRDMSRDAARSERPQDNLIGGRAHVRASTATPAPRSAGSSRSPACDAAGAVRFAPQGRARHDAVATGGRRTAGRPRSQE